MHKIQTPNLPINLIESRWFYNFNKVRIFIENNKRYPSRYAKNIEERNIANWVTSQKRAKNNKGGYKMTPERERLLESLPNWTWISKDKKETWEGNFQLLKEFVEKYDRYPSAFSSDISELKLERWVRRNRRVKKGGRSYRLTLEREKKLESLPNWKWDVLAENWNKIFESVKHFVEENDRYPSKHTGDSLEKTLSRWVSRQRKLARENKLSSNKSKLLESLPNWKWKFDYDKVWMENFLYTKYFIMINKKYPSRDSKDKKENQIAHWIAGQRLAKRGKGHRNLLSEERIKLMETLPGWKWVIQEKKFSWIETYKMLEQYLEEHNEIYPTDSSSGIGKRLNIWIGNQRQAKNGRADSSLSAEQIKLLEALPGWKWSMSIREAWFENANRLKKFIENNSRYPQSGFSIVEEDRMYGWLNDAVNSYKNQKLDKDQMNFLNSLPDWEFRVNKIYPSWLNKFYSLKNFIDTHSKYPSGTSTDENEKKLFNWLALQMYYIKTGKYNQKKKEMIENLLNCN